MSRDIDDTDLRAAARDMGVSVPTIREWMRALEAHGLVTPKRHADGTTTYDVYVGDTPPPGWGLNRAARRRR